jgi:hypothetical protein
MTTELRASWTDSRIAEFAGALQPSLSPNGFTVGGEGRVRGRRERLARRPVFAMIPVEALAKRITIVPIADVTARGVMVVETLPPHPTLSPKRAWGRGLGRLIVTAFVAGARYGAVMPAAIGRGSLAVVAVETLLPQPAPFPNRAWGRRLGRPIALAFVVGARSAPTC